MSRIGLVGIAVVALVAGGAGTVRAEDISAKKIFIKDNADPAKRQLQVQSADAGVQFSDAVSPDQSGASLHVYSATDDFCVILPAGADWVSKNGKLWKYKNKSTKNQAQLKDKKLLVKIKSGVSYSLADNGAQGVVNAQVQLGTGTRFCLRCSGNKKDDGGKFLGKDCAAAACDPEPSVCDANTATTSTTTTSTSSTTNTTCLPGPPANPQVVKGSLTATLGRFNYNATLGVPGANAACNSNFVGTHACTYAELQAGAAACDLAGLKDTAAQTVTSFWAIDSSAPALQQCNDDALGGSGLNWEYATAHTASRGQRVSLNNATGALGSLQTGIQCNIAGTSWVACCQ